MKFNPMVYNMRHNILEKRFVMPKTKVQSKDSESFGKRMARLRQAAGYSQRELAKEIGVSHRMVAYYETQPEHPLTQILPLLSKTIGVTSDQLLGIEKKWGNGRVRDTRLRRRFSQIETLPPADRRPIVQLIDTFLQGKKAERQIRKLVADQG